jgi:hypothetical protein
MKSETKAYIELLRFGLQNQGITYQDALQHLNNNGVSFHSSELTYDDALLKRHFHLAFESFSGDPFSIKTHSERYYLKLEAMSFLVSYESIESAKDDARRAEKLVRWAIGISVTATVVSILVQIVFR